jgi:uncharacterized SAM-binding protein YcdF (DUF218 family)
MRGRRRGPLRRLAWPIGVIVVIWLGGFVWFAESAVDYPAIDPRRTDAVVVLTGGRNRLAAGLDILQAEQADQLFVSGVYRGIDVAALLAVQEAAPEELSCCIHLGHEADDTAGNAAETAAWVADNAINTLRLVTSAYHMPRALVAFHAALPDTQIVPHPVQSDAVHLQDWYQWPGTSWLLFVEYNKYLVARVGALAGRLF